MRQDYSQLLGSASVGGKEAIIGTVMLQSGSNSNEVLTKVKQEIAKINARSSKFQIELLYDRQFLIDKTIKTVLKNLLEGILLVVAVLCFALGTLKSGMIVASTIIFSVLILSSCLNLFGISANLMSLGAIDFGLLVDSSVVLVEYIICHLHFSKKDHHKIENIAQLSSEVFKPVFVGMFIIILVYVPITLKDGGSFPLKTVAQVKENNDITSIPRIFGKRYSSLSIYLEDTNYEEFIKKIEAKIKEKNMLPDGYLIEWGGRFENFNNGKKQILTIVPFIILLIAFLLYKIFGKVKKVLIIFSSVPFALSGAIFLIYLCQIPITISVYIGFIALIGIGLLNSIILISTFKKTRNIEESCISRLRPILMTAFVASLGFLPMAFSRGIGAEVQQPIAITVIGGIIFSTIATLILSPVLIKKTSKDF